MRRAIFKKVQFDAPLSHHALMTNLFSPMRKVFAAHKMSVPNDDSVLYACGVCAMPFDKMMQLIAHTKHHVNNASFQCGICAKRYPRHHLLIQHSRVHTGARPFECDQCSKRFTTRGILTTHIRHAHAHYTNDINKM